MFDIIDIFLASTVDNIAHTHNSQNDPEVWFPKVSKSLQNAYNKDINRLRSIIKPKTRSTNHISIGEIHALIRNTHAIRRRMLCEKQGTDFTMKVLEYQEMFHEEAVRKIYSFSSFSMKLFFSSLFLFFLLIYFLR